MEQGAAPSTPHKLTSPVLRAKRLYRKKKKCAIERTRNRGRPNLRAGNKRSYIPISVIHRTPHSTEGKQEARLALPCPPPHRPFLPPLYRVHRSKTQRTAWSRQRRQNTAGETRSLLLLSARLRPRPDPAPIQPTRKDGLAYFQSRQARRCHYQHRPPHRNRGLARPPPGLSTIATNNPSQGWVSFGCT